jgi:HlyD family secretion protein
MDENEPNTGALMPKIARFAVPIVVGIIVVGAVLWWWLGRHQSPTELLLYGNVDLRQIELPFNGNERISAVLVQEGDHVTQGQLLARMDTGRLAPQVAKAQARANRDAAAADAENVRAQFARLRALSDSSSGRAVSRQDMDTAKAALDTAEARLAVNRKALALELAGPRKEDVAQGEAQLRGDLAQLALVQQQLKDADLLAPQNAVVRSRIVEPGEIASPQKSAFTLAITDPKWVRVYVAETDLGSVREGLSATVTVDAFHDRSFPGWVGFISPVAEFTPKSVETSELRSSLVYEVRVFVRDPDDELRLGMPASVHLPLRQHGDESTPARAGVPAVQHGGA